MIESLLRSHCCDCDECKAMGLKAPKWWDQNNFYHDRSCLVWGVEEINDYGDVLYRTFCDVQRPICNGYDCNDPNNGHVSQRGQAISQVMCILLTRAVASRGCQIDDNTFWCAFNNEPTAVHGDGRESWSQMLPDDWIES